MTDPDAKAQEVDRTVPKSVRDELLDLENVFGHGIGFQYTNGRIDGDVGIVVYVEEKLSEEDLDPDQVVPDEINGIRVDVVEKDAPKLSYDDSLSTQRGDRSLEHDPTAAGSAVYRVNSDGSTSWTGSFGVVVQDADGDLVSIVNRHILEQDDDTLCDIVQQPGNVDFGSPKQAGQINDTDNALDAATVVADRDDRQFGGRMYAFAEVGDPQEAKLGKMHLMTGCMSGYHSARCIAKNVSVVVSKDDGSTFTQEDCDEYSNYDFAEIGGNSGSWLGRVDGDGVFHPVGLGVAYNDDSQWSIQHSRISEDLVQVDPVGSTEVPTPLNSTDDPRLECAVADIDYEPHLNEYHVDCIFASTGGVDVDNGQVELVDSGGSTIESFTLSLPVQDWYRHEFVVDAATYGGQDITVRTNVDVETDSLDGPDEEQTIDLRDVSGFVVSIVDKDDRVQPGQTAEVTVEVENTSGTAEEQAVKLVVE